MIYLGFISFFIAAIFFDLDKKESALKKIVTCYLFILIVSFIGLRYYTGSDWSAYMKYFDSVTWQNKHYGFGYKFLNLACRQICDSYFFVQFLSTLFFTISLYNFFRKYTDYFFLCIFLSIAIYFREVWMAQVRQTLAISVLLYGTDYLVEKRRLKFLCIVMIASLFHITALIAIACIFFSVRLPKWFRITLCVFSLILSKMSAFIMMLLVFVASNFAGKLGLLVRSYLASSKYGNLAGDLSSGTYFFARWFLILLIIIFFDPKNNIDHIAINALIVLQLIISASITFALIGRLGYYIAFYAILGYTKLFYIKFIKTDKSFFYISFLLFISFFFLPYCMQRLSNKTSKVTGRSINYGYLPYYNVFFHPDYASLRLDWNQ